MFHAMDVLSQAFFSEYTDDAELAATIVAYVIKRYDSSDKSADEMVN